MAPAERKRPTGGVSAPSRCHGVRICFPLSSATFRSKSCTSSSVISLFRSRAGCEFELEPDLSLTSARGVELNALGRLQIVRVGKGDFGEAQRKEVRSGDDDKAGVLAAGAARTREWRSRGCMIARV